MGGNAAASLIGELKGLSAFQPAPDAAFTVVDEITGNRPRY
jgi:hypothetical protein